jgi:hypothetical protein
MFFPFGQFYLTLYHLRMTGVKFGSIWTSRCRDIAAEAGMHALMQAVRKGVASERYVLDSTSTVTNTGKAHQDAPDQFDVYLSDLKLDIELLEKTAEKQYRLDVLKSAIENYEDLASIGDTFNDDRQAHFEPKLRQYQQQIDEAESSDARTAAEKNLRLWEKIFKKGLCVVEQSINNQVDRIYTEFNQLVAELTAPPHTSIPDSSVRNG